MNLKEVLAEVKLFDIIYALVTGKVRGGKTYTDFQKKLKEKVPGSDMTKGEYFLQKLKDKGIDV